MLKRLRRPEPFGKSALTVAICALVLALVGGAYAAGGLTKSQEKQVTKIAKKYAGKPGAPGGNGTNGANGAPGEKGAAGTNGAPGASGESVAITKKGECTEFSNKSGSGKACNGTTGYAATLPSGKTLRGLWGRTDITNTGGEEHIATSFPVAVENAAGEGPTPELIAEGVTAGTGTGNLTSGSKEVTSVTTASGHFTVGSSISDTTAPASIPAGTTITKVEAPGGHVEQFTLSAAVTATATGDSLSAGLPSGCTGDYEHPGAEPGFLCVFAGGEGDVARGLAPEYEPFIIRASQSPLDGTLGFSIYAIAQEEGNFQMYGSYAVTAE